MKLPKSWNDPAFPIDINNFEPKFKGEEERPWNVGLTKGEYFTAKAMQSIYVVDGARDCTQKEVAHDAVNLAITTLLELEELEGK